jgi:hypothetical protein
MNDAAMVGTLFFDGACGMCTRSRDLLLTFNRTGHLQTEPLQGHRVAERLGIPPSRLLESARWLDSSGTAYASAESANAALSSPIGTPLPLVLCGSRAFGLSETPSTNGWPPTLSFCRNDAVL